MKAVLKPLQQGDAQAASEAYKKAVPVIDATVSKGLIHRNKARATRAA